MVFVYARMKIGDQVKSTAFIVAYLAFVEIFILRAPILNGLAVAAGIGLVVAGLAFFLEGLFLGIMPLGESCGLKLPGKAGFIPILLFSLLLGSTATLAEPAIGFLKAQGSHMRPWDAPLLYFLLNGGSGFLVGSICLGVGIAVALGVFRFLRDWPIKPFIFIITPVLLGATIAADQSGALAQILGLAWDTGGVTTGPVTVPLVIALGIGVSRIRGSNDSAASGLGVVTLASLFPIASVLALGALLAPQVPAPGTPQSFFSKENREKAIFVVGTPQNLEQLGFDSLEINEFKSVFPDSPESGREASKKRVGGDGEKNFFGGAEIGKSAFDAFKAVVPLALVLVITLILFLRERIREADALAVGLGFALFGMFLFNLGMEAGLANLGRQTGASLPKAYTATIHAEKTVVFKDVGETQILKALGGEKYLLIDTGSGPEYIHFDPERWDSGAGIYRYIPEEPAIFSLFGEAGGIFAIILFVFILGIGATLAEPSLSALGVKIEEITTGTYKKNSLIRTVAIGVGLGMAAGFGRILSGLPISWLLGGAYGIALLLTVFSSEDFAAIAWDAAGVTTGPVTVPLVIAAGIGIGGGEGAANSFGIVAAASVFPIIAVLASGIAANASSRKMLGAKSGKV